MRLHCLREIQFERKQFSFSSLPMLFGCRKEVSWWRSYQVHVAGFWFELSLTCWYVWGIVMNSNFTARRQSILYYSCFAFSVTLKSLTAARVVILLFHFLVFWTMSRILKDTKAPDCNRSCVFQYICESASEVFGEESWGHLTQITSSTFHIYETWFQRKKRCRIGLENRMA